MAVYPNLWMSDELGLSECLSPVLVALVLWAAYRFWKRPGSGRSSALGAAVGLATLARDELSLLAVLIVVPLVLMASAVRWRRRIGLLAVAGLTMLLIVGPWVGYNMSRFDDPVFISSGFGVTLASSNCAELYQGPYEGYWSLECAVLAKDSFTTGADESVQGAEAQAYALRFIRPHENRLLPVEMARLGRAFGLFHPLQQIRLDSTVETRPYRWALVGLGMYYALVALSVGGLVILAPTADTHPPPAGGGAGRGRLGGPDLRSDPLPDHLRGGPGPGGRRPAGLALGPGPAGRPPHRRRPRDTGGPGDGALPEQGPGVVAPLGVRGGGAGPVAPGCRAAERPASSGRSGRSRAVVGRTGLPPWSRASAGAGFNDSGEPAANLRGVAKPGGRCPVGRACRPGGWHRPATEWTVEIGRVSTACHRTERQDRMEMTRHRPDGRSTPMTSDDIRPGPDRNHRAPHSSIRCW